MKSSNPAFIAIFMTTIMMLHVFSCDIRITNELNEIVQQKRIDIVCFLDPTELGIFSGIQFSINVPEIHLLSWEHDGVAQDIFIPPLKKTKRLFTKSLHGHITFECPNVARTLCSRMLQQSTLYMTGFSVNKHGIIKPFVQTVKFYNPEQDDVVLQDDGVVVDDKAPLDADFVESDDLDVQFMYIDQIAMLVMTISQTVMTLVSSTVCMLVYVICLILLLFYGIARSISFFQKYIPRLFFLLMNNYATTVGLFAVIGMLFFLKRCILLHWVLFAAVCVCLMVYCYALVTKTDETFFVGRLKTLTGIVAGSMILPFFVRALLAYNGY